MKTARIASERAKKFIWDNIDGGRIIEILKEVEPNHYEFAWSHYRETQDDGHSKWVRSKKTAREIVESRRNMGQFN